MHADVSKRFVTFQYLPGDLGGGTKPYKNAVQKGRFSFPADQIQKKRTQHKTGFAETEFPVLNFSSFARLPDAQRLYLEGSD